MKEAPYFWERNGAQHMEPVSLVVYVLDFRHVHVPLLESNFRSHKVC